MGKRNISKLLAIILALVLLLSVGSFLVFRSTHHQVSNPASVVPATTSVTYHGEDGKDALTLLKKQTFVAQNASGLVTLIGNREADTKKHEYWAFYVNGKYAPVGPKDYITKSSDTILWKIEKY